MKNGGLVKVQAKLPYDVPHMCPDLEEVARFIHNNVDRSVDGRIEAVRKLETVKNGIHLLRINISYWREIAYLKESGKDVSKLLPERVEIDFDDDLISEEKWWGTE